MDSKKIDNSEVKRELIEFIGHKNLKMLRKFLEEKKTPFPLIVEDGIPIATNIVYGIPIRNHINEKMHIFPDIIDDYTMYEDYIYYTLVETLEELRLDD